jgi:putative hemolysin
VLGELVPKRLAMVYADRWATVVAIPMQFLSKIGAPVVWLLQRSTNALLRILPTGGVSQSEVTDDDVRALATEGMQTGALHRHEAEMIDSVLRLADRSIGAIMVPRGDILWLDVNEPVATLWDEARRSGHARFLLCRGELEQLIGVISLANLGSLRRGAIEPNWTQQPLHVPETFPSSLLETFRRSSMHLGVVTMNTAASRGW